MPQALTHDTMCSSTCARTCSATPRMSDAAIYPGDLIESLHRALSRSEEGVRSLPHPSMLEAGKCVPSTFRRLDQLVQLAPSGRPVLVLRGPEDRQQKQCHDAETKIRTVEEVVITREICGDTNNRQHNANSQHRRASNNAGARGRKALKHPVHRERQHANRPRATRWRGCPRTAGLVPFAQ